MKSRSFARARCARSVLTPCPPLRICGEGGRKGSPEFPLSTSWRGGQGVRTNEGERSAVILSAQARRTCFPPGAKDLWYFVAPNHASGWLLATARRRPYSL